MGECKHENADHLMPGDWFNLDDVPQHIVTVEQFRCIDCGAWLSLGESDEHASKSVEIEIRAAELVASVNVERAAGRRTFLTDVGFDGAEVAGWVERQYDSNKTPEQFGERAGYLARAIVEHMESDA